MKLKQILLISGGLFLAHQINAQGGTATNTYLSGRYVGYDFSNGINPLFFKTNDTIRMRLNGVQTQSIANYLNQNTSGFLGLGSGGNASMNSEFATSGPITLLQMKGRTGNFVSTTGYRPWMYSGISFSDNQDFGYIGLRQVGSVFDITEYTLAWADNYGTPGEVGPDDLVFRFMSSTQNGTTDINSNDLRTYDDLDGLHLARFTSNGHIGFGNTFGVNPTGTPSALYSRPQSLLHMSYDFRNGTDNEAFGFLQITYRRPPSMSSDIIGQGEASTDGLRFGIDNETFTTGGSPYLNGYLRWQESSSFIIQTEDNASPNIQSNERLRITSVGALVLNQGAAYGGNTSPSNATRIGISYLGNLPVTKPLSVLHIGVNGGTDWRPWMEVGTYTSSANAHLYTGFYDATNDLMLSWGGSSSNNLRFAFTNASGASGEAGSVDGLEGMRMTPTTNDGVYVGIGGDPNANPYGPAGNSATSTATLEVNSWGATSNAGGSSGLRFTNLNSSSPTTNNPGQGMLSVDADGDVVYVPAIGLACWDLNGNGVFDVATEDQNGNALADIGDCQGIQGDIGPQGPQGPAGPSGTGAHNGTSMSNFDPTKVALGQDVGQNDNAAVLLNNREIPMNQQQIRFNNGFVNVNSQAGEFNAAGLNVRPANNDWSFLPYSPWAGNRAMNVVNTNGRPIGLEVNAIDTEPSSIFSIGIIGAASSTNSNSTVVGVDGYGDGKNLAAETANNGVVGVRGTARDSKGESVAVQGIAEGNAVNAYGVYGWARGNSVNAFAVYGQTASSTATNQWAGYFDGNVHVNGNITASGQITPSDQQFKTNVQPLGNAMTLIGQLHPKTYNYNANAFPTFGFETDQQMGLIAQEVETVIPTIVTHNVSPAKYDSAGTLLSPEIAYKGVEYQELIPLLVAGMQEQQATINQKDSLINDLNNRLTQLENCLSGILPYLCQMSHSAVQANTPQEQEAVRAQLSVQLSNRVSIVLDQNVPNPFAEQTVINFSIPETVQKAQIHFYDGNGKLIQSVDINERGLGSLTVFGSDLSRGTYSYTLVADGLIVATKKMVKQ